MIQEINLDPVKPRSNGFWCISDPYPHPRRHPTRCNPLAMTRWPVAKLQGSFWKEGTKKNSDHAPRFIFCKPKPEYLEPFCYKMGHRRCSGRSLTAQELRPRSTGASKIWRIPGKPKKIQKIIKWYRLKMTVRKKIKKNQKIIKLITKITN